MPGSLTLAGLRYVPSCLCPGTSFALPCSRCTSTIVTMNRFAYEDAHVRGNETWDSESIHSAQSESGTQNICIFYSVSGGSKADGQGRGTTIMHQTSVLSSEVRVHDCVFGRWQNAGTGNSI